MGVVIPTGFAQVSITFFLAGDAEKMVATIGCESGGEDNPSALADEVFTRLVGSGTQWAASSLAVEYRLGPFEATIMTATGPQTGVGGLSQGGTAVGQLAPSQNVAWLCQKRTARGGRRGRGRMYFPPANLLEGDVSPAGVIGSGRVTSLQVSMTEFLLAMQTASQDAVLLHSPEAGPIAPDPITGLVVSPIVATQRQRLRR